MKATFVLHYQVVSATRFAKDLMNVECSIEGKKQACYNLKNNKNGF